MSTDHLTALHKLVVATRDEWFAACRDFAAGDITAEQVNQALTDHQIATRCYYRAIGQKGSQP